MLNQYGKIAIIKYKKKQNDLIINNIFKYILINIKINFTYIIIAYDYINKNYHDFIITIIEKNNNNFIAIDNNNNNKLIITIKKNNTINNNISLLNINYDNNIYNLILNNTFIIKNITFK